MERDFKDMLSALSDEDEAWPNRLEVQLDGLAVMVIGREELLKNKNSTGRLKDVSDAKLLERQKANEKS